MPQAVKVSICCGLFRGCESRRILHALDSVNALDVVNGAADFCLVFRDTSQSNFALVNVDVEVSSRDGAVFYQGCFCACGYRGIIHELAGGFLALEYAAPSGEKDDSSNCNGVDRCTHTSSGNSIRLLELSGLYSARAVPIIQGVVSGGLTYLPRSVDIQ